MVDEYYPVLLGALVGLVAYLWISVERRQRAEDAKFQAAGAERWRKLSPGAPTHISAIAPQIQRLRQDYLAVVQPRPRFAFYRRGLLAAALTVVGRLPYFHR